MNLFTSQLFSSTMQSEPRLSRSYREPLFAVRYGRRRADRTAPATAPLRLASGTIGRVGETSSPIDYDRAA
jgi:hypothetical protein